MMSLLIQLKVVDLPARVMPTKIMHFFLICMILRSPRSRTVKRLELSQTPVGTPFKLLILLYLLSEDLYLYNQASKQEKSIIDQYFLMFVIMKDVMVQISLNSSKNWERVDWLRQGDGGSIMWITYLLYSLNNPSLYFSKSLLYLVWLRQKLVRLTAIQKERDGWMYRSIRKNTPKASREYRRHYLVNLLMSQLKRTSQMFSRAIIRFEQSCRSIKEEENAEGRMAFTTSNRRAAMARQASRVTGSEWQRIARELMQIALGRNDGLMYLGDVEIVIMLYV